MAGSQATAVNQPDILLELDVLFPIPPGIEQIWLLDTLIEILRVGPWLVPLVGGATIPALLATRREQIAQSLPAWKFDIQPDLLTGDFERSGALIGHGLNESSREMQLIRGLYWVALRRWWREGRLDHQSVAAFGAALRACARSIKSTASSALEPVLIALAKANDYAGALAAFELFGQSSHKSLRNAWLRGLRQILTDPAPDEAPPPSPKAPKRSRPRPTPWTRSRGGRQRADRDEVDDDRTTPVRIRLLRRTPMPDQLPDEPPDEFTTPTDLVIVPGLGSGAVPGRYATYQARQAIWGGNPLLLVSHLEVLTPLNYGAALRCLAAQLERVDLPDRLVTGLLVCLVKAITGRTTPGVQVLCRSLQDASSSFMRVDLDRGAITFPPYWHSATHDSESSGEAVGYFQPTPAQADYLEPADGEVELPLPRSVRQALGRHAKLLAAAADVDDLELDAIASEAAATVAAELGFGLSVATLRRSLGTQIAQVSGDVGMAQMVCGDSFGLTSAHQHYSAFRRKDIARAYTQAVCTHFQYPAHSPLPQAGRRVGSQLLVTPAAARALADSSHDGPLPDAGCEALPQWLCDHRRKLDHLARMIIATTGHRPAETLFELTVHDFDLQAGIALYRDKRHDIAHDPRLVVLPTLLCKQIAAYIRHLDHLATTTPHTQDAIQEVLSGQRGLLTDFDSDGNVEPMTLAQLKARSPAPWAILPWNWSRTFIRTRAIEMGASAFAVSCQLGHYDIVGYPYCQQSPTIPLEVARELRPILDRIAAIQGWSVIDDTPALATGAQMAVAYEHLPPLRDWTARAAQVEQAAAQAHRTWERDLRALARQDREAAIEQVLAHPTLTSTGVSTAYRVPHITDMPEPLDELTVHEIRADLVEQAGDDAPTAIALLRALRQILRRATEKTGQPYPQVSVPIVLRRPLDNPFFPGACLALTQLQALREHVAERARIKQPVRTYLLQVARTTEALALFGYIDRADQLLAILDARSKAAPSAKIPDLMLVPLPDHTVVGLRGVAALALAALGQAYPDEPLPSRQDINAAMATIQPAWAIADHATATATPSPDLLDQLCSTVAIANRFELAPAARFAVDPHHGATHADITEQLAFIDGDPVAPLRELTDPAAATQRPQIATPVERTQRSTANRQYLALCRAIPSPHKALHLPLTGVTVAANAINQASTRQSVIAELDAQLAQPTLWPIVRMLTSWIRAEATRHAGSRGALADSTLSTYLTRIGRTLVQTLGDLEFSALDEDALEDAFSFCLDASRDAKHKVAAALLSFHAHCIAHWDLPDLDLGFVYAQLDHGRHAADAALILPVERDAAMARIDQMAWGQTVGFDAARVARLAQAVAYPVAWGGCRINEALGLQARDIGQCPDGAILLRVRSNRRRRLKTLASSRLVRFRSSQTELRHRARVLERVGDIRRQADRRPDSIYLIDDAAPSNISSDGIAYAIRDALAKTTGRATERLHRLRHLIANEWICDVALSHQDRGWVGLRSDPIIDAHALTPRDFAAIAISLGHAHWRTTIQCYLHLPWILQSRSAQYMRDRYFQRRHVAGALGYTPATLDWILREREVDRVTAWFDYFRPGRVQPDPSPLARPDTTDDAEPVPAAQPEHTAEEPPATTPKSMWTAVRLGHLVTLAAKVRDLESAMRSIGAPMEDLDAVISIATRWERKLGLRVLPTHAGGIQRHGCPVRAVRRVHADRDLERMWRDFDDAQEHGDERKQQLIDDFFTWLQPSRHHAITLPRDSADFLAAWLTSLGITSAQIQVSESGGGLVEISVRRSVNLTDHRHRGMGLRRILAVVGMAIELRQHQ